MHVERVSVDSNFFDDLGADSMVMARFCARVRKRPDLPRCRSRTSTNTPRSEAWRRHSPTPRPSLLSGCFADVLADVVRVERVSVDSNFFDDLGADSMVMAQFCARVRKRPDLPAVSIKDIYQHPTIASLADGTRRTPRPSTSSESPASGDLDRGGQTGENIAGTSSAGRCSC